MKVLIFLIFHHQLGDTGRRTGFGFEELAADSDAIIPELLAFIKS